MKKVLVLFITCVIFPSNSDAQSAEHYFKKQATWEETLRDATDQVCHDYIHKTGEFKFVPYYQHNLQTFEEEIDRVLRRTFRSLETGPGKQRMRREMNDGIWLTDRQPGDYRPMAVKMAWKIHNGHKKGTIELANLVENWEDFLEIREVYHLYHDLKTPLANLEREFNSNRLIQGIDYLAELNQWDKKFADQGIKQIQQYDVQKQMLLEKAEEPYEGIIEEIDDFLDETSKFLITFFVTKNKLIGTDSIIYVERFPFKSNHYYTDYVNGSHLYGGNLYSLNLITGEKKELVPKLQDGIINRYDLDYEAGKVIFDWKEEQQTGFRIFEKDLVSGALNQVTFPLENEDELIELYRVTDEYHHGTDDMHPVYLPDGDVCFISTRCQYGILCDAPDNYSTTVLYRMKRDGSHMEKLTNSSVSESNPSVMLDGRILYTRWEYYDKGAVSVKCLWAMRPDGTNPVEIYGNTLALPPTLLMGRQIPGHPDLFSCLGTPHCCPQNGVGTVLKIDTRENQRTREPLTYITPNTDIRAEAGIFQYSEGEWKQTDSGPLYCDPYPLNDKMFLVSHNQDQYFNADTAWGLYLIDAFGNHIRIYRNPEISCWQPIPFKTRKKPPVISSSLNPELKEKGLAAVLVKDVSFGMENVSKEEIKFIRVNEQVPRPWKARRYWDDDIYDQQHALITKDTHLGLKVQHGIVPVEKDGSAYFLVPADKNISFQVLDENFMEIQRERTYNNYRPGEFRSCTGCHETKNMAPLNTGTMPLAFKKKPQLPGPQPGETTGLRPIDYMTDVQPVWDKHCIQCHAGPEPEGGLDLSGELTEFFCVSYENLVPERRESQRNDPGYLGIIIGENHPKEQNVHYLPANSLGSRTSELMKMIRDGHEDVTLSREELIRISTWIDSNAQYYGTYFGKKNLKYQNDSDFRPVPTIESALGNN
jgi:hypothetical protein